MNPFARMANYEELNIIGTGKHIGRLVWIFTCLTNSILFSFYVGQVHMERFTKHEILKIQAKLLHLKSNLELNCFLFLYTEISVVCNSINISFYRCLYRVRVALTEDGVPMSTLREIALLKQLDAFKHPNIVK